MKNFVSISEDQIDDIIASTGGKIFSIEFVKKDGEVRNLVTRLNVTKGVKGESASDSAKRALATFKERHPHLRRFYDLNKHVPTDAEFSTKGAWRMVNIETVRQIVSEGVRYVISEKTPVNKKSI